MSTGGSALAVGAGVLGAVGVQAQGMIGNHKALGQGHVMLSFFNFIHWFFFIPFTITLVMKGYAGTAWIWCISMLLFVYINNFLAISLLFNYEKAHVSFKI